MQIELESVNTSILKSKKQNANLRGNSLIISPQLSDYLKEFNLPLLFSDKMKENGAVSNNDPGYFLQLFNYASDYISKAANVELLTRLNLPAYFVYIGENSDLPVSESLLFSLGIATPEDFRSALKLSFKFNAVLRSFFERRGSDLVAIKIRFSVVEGKVSLIGDLTYSDILLLPSEEEKDIIKYIRTPDEKNTKKHIKFINKILE
ncbi:hypothetical protein MASR1M107_19500 [Ignavibacteriales bacterium]